MRTTKETVPVSGVWTRTINGQLQILLEVEGKWRLVGDLNLHQLIDSNHGKILEASGIKRARETR